MTDEAFDTSAAAGRLRTLWSATADERAILAWFAAQSEAVDLARMFNALAPKPPANETSKVRNRKRRLTALDDAATFLYRAGLTRVARLGNGLNRTTLWEITDAGREALAVMAEEQA